jgi:predicted RNase H-like HicB family nuclease
LALEYPFSVMADPDGGYVISFPDLPGCITEVDSLEEVGRAAKEARDLWLESAYAHGLDIPEPSYPEEYSGKFNLRLPPSLHRSLAEAARREGVSLNQYTVALLARGDAQARVERRLAALETRLAAPVSPSKA